MNDKQFEELKKEIQINNKLLILLLRKFEVRDNVIAKALNVTPGRLSQILPLNNKNKD